MNPRADVDTEWLASSLTEILRRAVIDAGIVIRCFAWSGQDHCAEPIVFQKFADRRFTHGLAFGASCELKTPNSRSSKMRDPRQPFLS